LSHGSYRCPPRADLMFAQPAGVGTHLKKPGALAACGPLPVLIAVCGAFRPRANSSETRQDHRRQTSSFDRIEARCPHDLIKPQSDYFCGKGIMRRAHRGSAAIGLGRSAFKASQWQDLAALSVQHRLRFARLLCWRAASKNGIRTPDVMPLRSRRCRA